MCDLGLLSKIKRLNVGTVQGEDVVGLVFTYVKPDPRAFDSKYSSVGLRFVNQKRRHQEWRRLFVL